MKTKGRSILEQDEVTEMENVLRSSGLHSEDFEFSFFDHQTAYRSGLEVEMCRLNVIYTPTGISKEYTLNQSQRFSGEFALDIKHNYFQARKQRFS